MTEPTTFHGAGLRLNSAIVLRVQEEVCEIVSAGRLSRARYAKLFPSPRVKRVSPGHLVAVGRAPDGSEVVVWRWYDAVVLGAESGLLRLWEPSHGEVLAQQRDQRQHHQVGSRAYVSAGLPGAEWWVAGGTTADPESAKVELGEVELLYTDNDLWPSVI